MLEYELPCMENEEFKKKVISRLNRIDGQIRGIEKMIIGNITCDEILNQVSSVKSALNGVAKFILETHLKSCVIHDIKLREEKKVIDEFIQILDSFIEKKNKKSSEKNDDLIRKIEIQIDKMRKAIESNQCSSLILKEIANVKNELDGMARVILENHVRNCFVNELKYSNENTVIDNFIYTVNKMIK